MKINSKLLFVLVIIFSITNLLDVITAMFILPGEANPIYLLTHSIALLWILKVGFMALVLWIYFKNEYPSRFWFFSYIYVLVIGNLMLSLGVYSNVMGILNPAVVEAAAQITTAQKVSYYSTLVGFLMVIPYIISMISFKIYDVTEKKIKYKADKEKELWDLMSQAKK